METDYTDRKRQEEYLEHIDQKHKYDDVTIMMARYQWDIHSNVTM